MKKALIITGIIVAVLILALALLPVILKKPLLEKAKTAINQNVDADVEFADLNLSFFRSFPKINLELVPVSVTGRGAFSNDTLLLVPSLRTKTALGQLF